MEKEKCFESYPFWMVFLSNLVSLSIYFIGAFIIYKLGLVWLVLYILFIAIQEFRLIKGHCVNCHYYGKVCAFGKGKISSLFFKKGNSSNFCSKKMTWKDMLPDFMVSLVPIAVGIVLLVKSFNWLLLILVLILFLLTSIGNSMIRGKLACKYCKQRKLGCPAQKLFKKKRS